MPGRRFCSNCFPYFGIFIVINFLLSHIFFIAIRQALLTPSFGEFRKQKRRLFCAVRPKVINKGLNRVLRVLVFFQNNAGTDPISGVLITIYKIGDVELLVYYLFHFIYCILNRFLIGQARNLDKCLCRHIGFMFD